MTNSHPQKSNRLSYNRPVSKLIFIFSLLLVNTAAFAQNGFEFGVRYLVTESALFNKSDKNAGPELDYANTLSYLSGGITGSYNFNKHIGLEMDILFSRQGQNYAGNNMLTPNSTAYNSQIAFQAFLNDKVSAGNYKAKAELNCFKIPLLFKLATNNTKRIYYTLSAGPQVNILHNAVYEINKEDVSLPGVNIVPNDVYRTVTVDGVLALGAGLNLSRHFAVNAQARFDYGFQDVEKKDATYSYMGISDNKYYGDGRATTHNATAALMIGLNYKL